MRGRVADFRRQLIEQTADRLRRGRFGVEIVEAIRPARKRKPGENEVWFFLAGQAHDPAGRTAFDALPLQDFRRDARAAAGACRQHAHARDRRDRMCRRRRSAVHQMLANAVPGGLAALVHRRDDRAERPEADQRVRRPRHDRHERNCVRLA